MFLSKNLTYLSSQKNLRKSDLARALDVSPQQIGKYLKGDNQPKLEYLIELARTFDVSLDDLVLIDLTKEKARPFGAEGEDKSTLEETLIRMNELLDQRLRIVEQALKKSDPDAADALGIK